MLNKALDHWTPRTVSARFALSIGIFLAALGLRFAILPVEARLAYVTFYPATAFTFYLCGIGPGLLLVALSAMAGFYIFTPPAWTWTWDSIGLMAVGSFVASSLLVAWVVNRQRHTSGQLVQVLGKLAHSERRLHDIVNEQSDIVCRFDSEGGLTFANDACRRLFGLTEGDLRHASWKSIVEAADLPEVQRRLRTLTPAQPRVTTENRIRLHAGGWRWAEFTNHAVFDSEGRLLEIQSVGRDTTERKALESRLQRVNREQEAMLNSDLIGIARVRDRMTIWANDKLAEMFHYGREEIMDQPTRLLYLDDASYRDLGEAAYRTLREGGHYRAQMQMACKGGEPIWVDISGTLLSEETGESLWMMLDISEMKRHQQQFEKLATYDTLTGLPNRLLLSDRLRQGILLTQRLRCQMAVCFIDLDGFKAVNDRHGHEAGDELLRVIASRLQTCVRGNDTVARLGGDEFVLLLSQLHSREECEAILARALAAISEPATVAGEQQIAVSGSIGVAVCPTDGSDEAELLALADAAMYKAKRAGRNQLHFN